MLRVLMPRRRLRWQSGHASGPRLELRRAMQFEADPRQHRSLWARPVLPQRREPAVALLLDRSSSMTTDRRIDRAFEGLVLLVEVCHRIGVAAAVWSFASDFSRELAWSDSLDAATRGRLGRIPGSCAGNTRMAAALAAIRRSFARQHGSPKLLFVLSDGEPDQPNETLREVGKLGRDGIATIGLGLGPRTDALRRFFPQSVTGIQPERIVDHVAGLLQTSLVQQAG